MLQSLYRENNPEQPPNQYYTEIIRLISRAKTGIVLFGWYSPLMEIHETLDRIQRLPDKGVLVRAIFSEDDDPHSLEEIAKDTAFIRIKKRPDVIKAGYVVIDDHTVAYWRFDGEEYQNERIMPYNFSIAKKFNKSFEKEWMSLPEKNDWI